MDTTPPETHFLSLIQPNGSILTTEATVEKIFNGLKPVPPTFLLGEWDAGELETGHAGSKALRELRWAGKNFRSVDDGDPVMVVDEAGRRVKGEEWGGASLREMVYRGVTSAAMIYDIKPIIDHFRFVTEDIVLGAMDAPKVMGTESVFYFFLKRRKGEA